MNTLAPETAKEAARRLSAPMLDKGFNPIALHTYTDASGLPAYYRIRCKHPDTKDKWIRPMKLNGHGYELGEPKFQNGKPLYALHRIVNNSKDIVWITEGEQKVDALNKLSLMATTSGGATSADTTDWEPLRNRTVKIFPDNDGAGKAYAGIVANILLGMGCTVSCVDVDKLDLGTGEDVMEWLAAHPESAAADIETLPMLTSWSDEKVIKERIVALEIRDLLTRNFPPMEAMLSPWLCKQHLSMVHAWRGVGKTHFALGVAYAVAGGGQFLRWKSKKTRRVVYIDGEMAGAAIKARLAAIVEATPEEYEPPEGFLRIITPDAQDFPLPNLASREGQVALEPCIADAELIVVDNLSCLMHGGPENEGESWLPVVNWALNLRRQGKTVLFVHHDGKGGQQRGTSRKEDVMDVVIKLEHAKDYQAEKGAAFLVKFEKARHLTGDDAKNLEAALVEDEQGKQIWTYKDADLGMSERILALHAEAPDLNQSEIADELGCDRSTVSRAFTKAKQQSTGGYE